MDDDTENRILQKVEYIQESLIILGETRDTTTFVTYQQDRRQQDIVEREFQTSIEACLDIGSMILRAEGTSVPETNAAVFRTLSQSGILTNEVGKKMAEAAGFRNILTHKYGSSINNRDVFNFLTQELYIFREYLTQIRDFLDTEN